MLLKVRGKLSSAWGGADSQRSLWIPHRRQKKYARKRRAVLVVGRACCLDRVQWRSERTQRSSGWCGEDLGQQAASGRRSSREGPFQTSDGPQFQSPKGTEGVHTSPSVCVCHICLRNHIWLRDHVSVCHKLQPTRIRPTEGRCTVWISLQDVLLPLPSAQIVPHQPGRGHGDH